MNIVTGENSVNVSSLSGINYGYEYPNQLNLRPGSKLHDSIVSKVMERARESAKHMQTRFASWNQQDQYLTAYKMVDDDETKVQLNDPRKPVSIVFPYSYAILETLLSYMMTAFFRDPIFKYEGYSPEDVLGSIKLEKVINLHCNKFKAMLNLHTMWRDAFVYGVGAVAPYWKTTKSFAGNALRNIDQYTYLPDPNVPAGQVQDGEFIGWVNQTNYIDLLTKEQSDLDFFNVHYLKDIGVRRTTVYSENNSNRNLRTGSTKSYNSNILHPVDEIPMYIKIVPKEWGLSNSEYPEKYLFQVAADSILIKCRPADFDHDKFPIATCCPDSDGYSASPLSRLEILGGLQGVLDWLFNSHVANVRKAINDMIIYDPYAINSADLSDPQPGKLIRMRRPLWGKGGINQYIQQLNVNDITKQNINDSGWIVNWMQKIGATDDAAMGSLREGGPERLTKAEFQGTSAGAVSRLERIARIISLQGMTDIGEFFAEHTKQMMTDDAYVKVSGDWEQVLMEEFSDSINRGRMKVSPRDLDINYDVIVSDGSVSGGNYNDIWMRMFENIVKEPSLAQTFDVVKIFKYIARNSGAKNVNDFVKRGGNIQPQVMPNEQIQQQAQAGNIIPINAEMR